jgi:hypothetical protein
MTAYNINNREDIDSVLRHMDRAHRTEIVETPTHNIYTYKDSDGVTIGYDVMSKESDNAS